MTDDDLLTKLGTLEGERADAEQELLDRYALGELSPGERRELDRRSAVDRDFASRLELYRPLDTYERRVLADRVVRGLSAPRTRRRPALFAIGAGVAATLGVAVLVRRAGSDPELPAYSLEIENLVEADRAPSSPVPALLRASRDVPPVFVLRPAEPFADDVDARVFLGADRRSLRAHPARVERSPSGSLRVSIGPLSGAPARGTVAIAVYAPGRQSVPTASFAAEAGAVCFQLDYELR